MFFAVIVGIEACFRASQISMMERFSENSERLEAVN